MFWHKLYIRSVRVAGTNVVWALCGLGPLWFGPSVVWAEGGEMVGNLAN